MRIKDLHIEAFGHFVDRTFEDLPSEIVLIHGENESGKSTLFSLLKAMLYGFYPVKDYPYRPWHVDKYPEFTASIALEDDGEANIHRKLRKGSATGTFELNEAAQDLSNHDLPVATHVSMDLYEALYALTQANKRQLDGDTRQTIDDRLLGGLGSDILRPTREVIAELEDEATDLWRSDRRGSPRDSELRKKLRKAREARREAEENDKELREKAEQVSKTEAEIQEHQEKLAELNATIKTGEKLIPLKNKLEQIETWRQEIPNIDAVEGLPEGIKPEYRRLSENVSDAEQNLQQLKDEKDQLLDTQQEYGDEHEHILSREEDIKTWLRNISGHQKEWEQIKGLEKDTQKTQSKLERQSERVLASEWDESLSDSLKDIVLPDLKTRIQQYEKHAQEARDIKSDIKEAPVTFSMNPLPSWTIFTAGIAGLALLALGIVLSISLMTGIGAAIGVVSAFGYGFNKYLYRQKKAAENKRKEREQQLQDALAEAESQRDAAQEAIKDIFSGLPVAKSLFEQPDMDLYRTVEDMQKTLGQLEDLREEVSGRTKEWENAQEDLRRLTSEFGEEPSENGIRRLEQRLQDAREAKREAQKAGERIEEIDEDKLPEMKDELDTATGNLESLKDKIRAAVAESMPIEDALDEATQLQNTVRRIREAEEQLENDYPDLENLKREIRELEEKDEEIDLNQTEIEDAKLNREESNEKLQDLRDTRGSLESDVENARDQTSVGELDGEIQRLEEEQARVRRERDRLVLLSNILRKADRDFRDKHQPDVLQGASRYFSSVADGYQSITTLTGDEGEERLAVRKDDGKHLKVEPNTLSGGTLDQVYLSFRLAVVDHLDKNQERLPLVLDETMINWDDDRMIKGAEILSSAAEERQIFFFTCHKWVADKMAEVVGSVALRL